MIQKNYALYKERAKIIKALAHPTRLFIVDQLAQGEMCVCEIHEMIDADISTISKHLAVLRNAGILSDNKRGAQVYYTLKVPCLKGFFECIESIIRSHADEQIELTKLECSR